MSERRTARIAVGVFRACVTKEGDGFRAYDAALGGYRYYGLWNQKDAVACAAYSDAQLRLTFHHEVFHHVDATRRGRTNASLLTQDAAFTRVQEGRTVYPALTIAPTDFEALLRKSAGHVLENAVGTIGIRD